MATTTNTVKFVADDAQLLRSLQNIRNQVSQVNNTFGTLKSAIAGIAFGALIRNAIQFADAIQDVSDATGVAIQNLLGFSQAVTLNGGSAEKANTAVLKLTQTIGAAASGSKESLKAFAAVGVSLSDIMTMSEQDILAKTIDGLGRMTDASQRARVQQEIFGKTLMGVNVQGVAAGFANATAGAAQYAESVRRAAELQNQLDLAFGKLREGILRALEPMIKFVNALSPDQIERIVKAVVEIGVALGSLAVGIKVFGAIGTALAAVGGYAVLAKTGLLGIGKTITVVTGQIGYFTKGWASATGAFAKLGEVATFVFTLFTKRLPFLLANLARLVPVIAAVSAAFYALKEVVQAVTGVDLFKKIGEYAGKAWDFVTGKTREAKEANDANNESLAETKRLQEAAAGTHAKAAQEQIDRGNEIRKILGEQAQQLNDVVEGYRRAADEALNRYEIETDLINATERQRLEYEAFSQTQNRFFQEYFKLYEEYKKLSQEQGELEQRKAQQVAAALQELTKVYGEEAAAIMEATAARAAANEARAFEQYTIQQVQKDYDDLRKVMREIERGPMTEIERKYYDIRDAADASAEAAIRAEEARRGAPLSTEEINRYYEVARRGSDKLVSANQKLIAQQRTFSYGWQKAFKEYVDNATNAAKQAERMFEKFTSGIEDLIVNFAKTGKFEWKGFVNSMLEELLRSNIKSLMASVFQMQNPFSQMGGSVGDALGGLFGGMGGSQRGNSPSQPLYVVDIAGGGGASIRGLGNNPLISGGGIGGGGGGGGVIDTVKNVIGGLGSGVRSVVDTVSKIGGGVFNAVKSVGSSILGGISDFIFRANGGPVAGGKSYIVGERGPELFTPTGSGMISANGSFGGMTNVTYNINAVDAASFQALVARDPSFIFAVTEQGRKSLSGSRR